jgi:hypothetical protein
MRRTSALAGVGIAVGLLLAVNACKKDTTPAAPSAAAPKEPGAAPAAPAAAPAALTTLPAKTYELNNLSAKLTPPAGWDEEYTKGIDSPQDPLGAGPESGRGLRLCSR